MSDVLVVVEFKLTEIEEKETVNLSMLRESVNLRENGTIGQSVIDLMTEEIGDMITGETIEATEGSMMTG